MVKQQSNNNNLLFNLTTIKLGRSIYINHTMLYLICNMKIFLCLILAIVAASAHFTYPIRCVQIGDSVIGTVTDCDAVHDPLPFKWTTTILVKKSCKWAGADDVSYIYSNPDDQIDGNCILAAPLPATFKKGDQITIEQTCTSFSPPLVKGANLLVLVFYTHHDSIDDVLMYNFPIPGYITYEQTIPKLLSKSQKEQVLRKIRGGELKLRNIRSE